MTRKLNQISIKHKVSPIENHYVPDANQNYDQSENFQPLLHNENEILNNPTLLKSLGRLVQEGLTIYGDDLNSATLDLKNHLKNAQTIILFDPKDQVIGFGIYKILDSSFVDISFIVSKEQRSKGIGAKLLELGISLFDHQYFVASTQNVATFMAFKRVFRDNLIAPILKNGQLSDLSQTTYDVASKVANLKGVQIISPNGIMENYYPENGLYDQNINAGSDFPINTKSSKAIILVAKNPNFKA